MILTKVNCSNKSSFAVVITTYANFDKLLFFVGGGSYFRSIPLCHLLYCLCAHTDPVCASPVC